MNNIKKELYEILYKLRQNCELMKILNVAIEYNLESDNELAVINLSEIIQNQLKTTSGELDEILMKMCRLLQ